MATRTIQPRHAFAFWTTTHDIRDVTSSIIALLRIIGGRMTVDTPWVS